MNLIIKLLVKQQMGNSVSFNAISNIQENNLKEEVYTLAHGYVSSITSLSVQAKMSQ